MGHIFGTSAPHDDEQAVSVAAPSGQHFSGNVLSERSENPAVVFDRHSAVRTSLAEDGKRAIIHAKLYRSGDSRDGSIVLQVELETPRPVTVEVTNWPLI